MAQLLSRKGDHGGALQSIEKVMILMDSWEPTISIRKEVEQFNEVLIR
jgi:LuxR family glucitol operon transcriptional activator